MTDTSKQELIEEAAKALYRANWGDEFTFEEDREHWVNQARAALAVFEQAHTPTDDEREALAKVVAKADEETLDYERRLPDYYSDESWEGYRLHADHILAAGFRRTVQGEPTDAEVEALAAVSAEHDRQVAERAYKAAEDAAAEALELWWLTDTSPDEDTSSVMEVREAIRELRKGQS